MLSPWQEFVVPSTLCPFSGQHLSLFVEASPLTQFSEGTSYTGTPSIQKQYIQSTAGPILVEIRKKIAD